MRPSGRNNDELREITIETDFLKTAYSSVMIKFGNTHVLCTASIDNKLPPFLKNSKSGWVTAEYGMLPASTSRRMKREAAQNKQGGRTIEIQRLIGRSLRSVVDLKAFSDTQIIVDCDVIQADGGTRTASITGGYIAMHMAFDRAVSEGKIETNPITNQVAAISCGIYQNESVLDLDYPEDSNAQVDANFIMTGNGDIVEIQSCGEDRPFTEEEFAKMFALAKKGTNELITAQKNALICQK